MLNSLTKSGNVGASSNGHKYRTLGYIKLQVLSKFYNFKGSTSGKKMHWRLILSTFMHLGWDRTPR
ncbi:MAG: hypothetical protein Tsb0014_33990 [Pleurocapsa sp.]